MKMFGALPPLPEKCVISAASAQIQQEPLLFFFHPQFLLHSLGLPIFKEHQNANLITLWACERECGKKKCVQAYASCCIR